MTQARNSSAHKSSARTSSPAPHRAISGRLVIATHNPGKLVEMRGLLAPYGITALSARELGLGEPDETGMTFRDNARIKAEAAAKASALPAFADDSGLVVDALDGAPGIHSAHWAGSDRNFQRAMEAIEEKLRERGAMASERRKAHFVSALCVAWPDEFQAHLDRALEELPEKLRLVLLLSAMEGHLVRCLARRASSGIRGARDGLPGVAAARRSGFRLRSDFFAGWATTNLR